MLQTRNKKIALIALALTVVLAVQFTPAKRTDASDHIDAPTLAHDNGSDINDMYIFLDPNDNTRVVVIMNINPFLIY